MTTELNPVMLGAAATASLVAALFFLRFWRQSRDSLFLWFSVAFAIDALTRLSLSLGHISDEHQPFFSSCAACNIHCDHLRHCAKELASQARQMRRRVLARRRATFARKRKAAGLRTRCFSAIEMG